METPRLRVAVVGAGAAGLAAALRLRLAPTLEISVLEARDRVGGRVCTTAEGFDLGASWIHGASDGNMLFRVASAHGATLADNAPDVPQLEVRAANGESLYAGERADWLPWQRVEAVLASTADGDDVAAAMGAREPPAGPERTLWRAAVLLQRLFDGGAILNVAERRQYHDVPGPHVMVRGGMLPLLERMAEPVRARVRLGARVRRIDALTGHVELHTGELLGPFDAVVCALPVGVLAHESTMIAPPLPCWTALCDMQPGRVEKMVLTFEQRFWHCNIGMVMGGDAEQLPTCFSSLDGLKPASMIAWLVPDLQAPEDAEVVAERLRRGFGLVDGRPRLVHTERTRWADDPLSRGTYGLPGARRCDRASWRQWHGRLTLAGEYTSDAHYGCVHGALEEGFAAAHRVIERLLPKL